MNSVNIVLWLIIYLLQSCCYVSCTAWIWNWPETGSRHNQLLVYFLCAIKRHHSNSVGSWVSPSVQWKSIDNPLYDGNHILEVSGRDAPWSVEGKDHILVSLAACKINKWNNSLSVTYSFLFTWKPLSLLNLQLRFLWVIESVLDGRCRWEILF